MALLNLVNYQLEHDLNPFRKALIAMKDSNSTTEGGYFPLSFIISPFNSFDLEYLPINNSKAKSPKIRLPFVKIFDCLNAYASSDWYSFLFS